MVSIIDSMIIIAYNDIAPLHRLISSTVNDFQNVHPSLARSGDVYAVSMIRVFDVSRNDLRQYIVVFDQNLTPLWGM